MGEIILVVDDNQEMVDGLKLTLEMEGYQVLTAGSGQEALDILERTTPDLILADIMMPNLDGYELYVRVHNNPAWVQIPFVFLTAKTSKKDIRKGSEIGADAYITKPFDPQDVVATIRGKLKRVAELSGRPTSTDAIGNLIHAWHGAIGPVPVPVIALLAVAILMTVPLIILRPWCGAGDTHDEPLRPDVGEMITIPAGPFTMGGDAVGAPSPKEVTLPAFQIDKYEVTMQQYAVFVEETGHDAPWGSYPEGQDTYPVTNITWEDAQAYCEWAEKRLPSETEWEKAARGEEGYIYPWGNSWEAGLANTKEANTDGPKIVGSYPEGASPYGVMDMAGNVWEMTADWATPSQKNKVMRGGAWNAIQDWARTFSRNAISPTTARNNVGFRCAR